MNSFEDEREARRVRFRQALGPLPAPREVFDDWRSPREGTDNPTRMDNPVWAWLVRNRIGAYAVPDAYGAPYEHVHGPTWCFDRMGQTETQLPDGRLVYVGGEHEDYYDPDFHIYNDVVTISPDGEVSIMGYPKSVFPPTDFHSATLVGADLYLVGRLGYPEDRRQRIESVHVLDTGNYRIRTLQTSGQAPPWLHEHVAELDADGGRILVRGGKVLHNEFPILIENLDLWTLRISDGAWTRVERCPWPRWCLSREKPRANALCEIRQMLWDRSVGWIESEREQRAKLKSLLGADAQPDSIETLYSPPIQHQTVPRDEDAEGSYATWRVLIEGVVVRYEEDTYGVTMTIEGDLPDSVATILVEDLRRKLSAVEGLPYRVQAIRIE